MTPAKSYRVLLVEDEDLISMLTEDMLSHLGYEVSSNVANLEDGLQAAANENFDVAVLDINLNGLMSYPIADILLQRNIPFLFASGYGAHGIDPRYLSALALQKPYSIDALEQTLTRTLAKDH